MYKTLFSKQLISGTSSFCAKKAPGLFPILDNFRHYLEHLPKESIQNTNSTELNLNFLKINFEERYTGFNQLNTERGHHLEKIAILDDLIYISDCLMAHPETEQTTALKPQIAEIYLTAANLEFKIRAFSPLNAEEVIQDREALGSIIEMVKKSLQAQPGNSLAELKLTDLEYTYKKIGEIQIENNNLTSSLNKLK